jgi:hypothetical protein
VERNIKLKGLALWRIIVLETSLNLSISSYPAHLDTCRNSVLSYQEPCLFADVRAIPALVHVESVIGPSRSAQGVSGITKTASTSILHSPQMDRQHNLATIQSRFRKVCHNPTNILNATKHSVPREVLKRRSRGIALQGHSAIWVRSHGSSVCKATRGYTHRSQIFLGYLPREAKLFLSIPHYTVAPCLHPCGQPLVYVPRPCR